jgi:hypothetical protein
MRLSERLTLSTAHLVTLIDEQAANNVDARYSTNNKVARNQHINNFTYLGRATATICRCIAFNAAAGGAH